jgi:peptidoglycan/xylan/chitin deacetylase (PgdA/CDA1 family)
MSWQAVRELQQQGFDIGGHTVTHANLGGVSLETAKLEIANCRATLSEKLGQAVPNFAYPFGGRDNFSVACAEMVRETGFESSVSCHGGTVSASEDVYALHREPITTRHASPYHFGFDCVLDTLRNENIDRGYS